MSNESSSETNPFMDLSSFDHISTSVNSTRSSVIKSSLVKNTGTARIEIIDGGKAEPTIHIHRQDDKITKIEFACSCGKSTHLDLEYEEE